jgi:hypothetical protein
MKYLLVAPLFAVGFSSLAQTVDGAALKKENDALKQEMTGHKAQPSVGATNVAVASSDPDYQVKFVSCTASKRTQLVTLTFLLENTGPPTSAFIRNNKTFHSGNRTRAFDEQGNAYESGKTLIGTAASSTTISPGVSIKCTVELLGFPPVTTSLKQAEVFLTKTPAGRGKQTQPSLVFRDVPIVWKP